MKKIVFFLAFFTACILTAQNEPSAQLSRLYSLGTHPTRVNFVLPQNNPKQLRNKIVYTLDSLIYIVDWQGKGTFVQDENPILPVTDTTSLASDNDLLQLRNELARKLRTDSLEANRVIGNLIETNGENDVVLEPRNGTTLGLTKYRYGNNSIPVFDGASDVTQPFVRYSQNGHQFVGKVLTSRRAADSSEVVQKVQLDSAALTGALNQSVVTFYVFGNSAEKKAYSSEYLAKLAKARINDLNNPYPSFRAAQYVAAKLIFERKIFQAKIIVLSPHGYEYYAPRGGEVEFPNRDFYYRNDISGLSKPYDFTDTFSIALTSYRISSFWEARTGVIVEGKNTDGGLFHWEFEKYGIYNQNKTGNSNVEGKGVFKMFYRNNTDLISCFQSSFSDNPEPVIFSCDSLFAYRKSLDGNDNTLTSADLLMLRFNKRFNLHVGYVELLRAQIGDCCANNLDNGAVGNINIGKLKVLHYKVNRAAPGFVRHVALMFWGQKGVRMSVNINEVDMTNCGVALLYFTAYTTNNSSNIFKFGKIIQTYNDTLGGANAQGEYLIRSGDPNTSIYRNLQNTVEIGFASIEKPLFSFTYSTWRYVNSSVTIDCKYCEMKNRTGLNPRAMIDRSAALFDSTSHFSIKGTYRNYNGEVLSLLNYNGNQNTDIRLDGFFFSKYHSAIVINGDFSRTKILGNVSSDTAESIGGTGTITVMPSASANVGVGAGVTLNGTLSVNPNFKQ